MTKLQCAAALSVAMIVSACATEPYPSKRPLTIESMQSLGETDVVIDDNNSGVLVSWYMQDSSAAGAGYGLIGALTTAIIDAIANAGPSRRAERVASELYEVITPEDLVASMQASFQNAARTETMVTYGDVSSRQPILVKDIPVDTIRVSPTFLMAENGGAFKVTTTVTIDHDDLSYVTPYIFEKSVPKEQTSGPIYKNVFAYNSKVFEQPVLTDELKEQLATAITEMYRDAEGNLPLEDTDDAKSLAKELEAAKDDELTKSEASIFMVNYWISNDAAELKSELARANDFIAKYVMLDLNSDEVPTLEGIDEIVETEDDGRLVFKVNQGTLTGSYISQPGNVSDFVTYGNASMQAKDARDRASDLRKEAKAK